MKILTWNINGIRGARRDKSLKVILDSLEADVICLQETKVTRKCIKEVRNFKHKLVNVLRYSDVT